jgi:hypothetical protein
MKLQTFLDSNYSLPDSARAELQAELDMLRRPKFKVTENKDYSIERDPFGYAATEPGLFIFVSLQIGDRIYGDSAYLSPYYLVRDGHRYKDHLIDTLKRRIIELIIKELTDDDD